MAVIHVQSIQDAVSKGTLIELANDYRTSRTVRAFLPRQTTYSLAISTAAFSQRVEQGTVGDKQSRMEAICAFLNKALGLSGTPSPTALWFTFPGAIGTPENFSLKLEWFAPSKYWVVLLPDEQIRPILKLA